MTKVWHQRKNTRPKINRWAGGRKETCWYQEKTFVVVCKLWSYWYEKLGRMSSCVCMHMRCVDMHGAVRSAACDNDNIRAEHNDRGGRAASGRSWITVGFIGTVCTYKEFTFPSVYLHRNRHTAGNNYHNNWMNKQKNSQNCSVLWHVRRKDQLSSSPIPPCRFGCME